MSTASADHERGALKTFSIFAVTALFPFHTIAQSNQQSNGPITWPCPRESQKINWNWKSRLDVVISNGDEYLKVEIRLVRKTL